MIDFNIQYGLSTELFIDGRLNENIIIEEGCWYLCTDTAELFLGVWGTAEDGQPALTLKLINKTSDEFITEAKLAGYGFLTQHQDISHLATKASIPAKISQLDNDVNYATEQYVIDTIASQVPVESLAKKEEVLEVKTKLETEIFPTVQETIIPVVQKVETEILPTVQELTDKAATQEWVLDQNYLQGKYEVLPIDGMFIQYRDGEIRLNTQRVMPVKQEVGATGNPNMFYATFRAFAPEGATQCKEGLNGIIDTEYSQLTTDKNGRKYTTIWAALASFNGTSWSKWGDTSTLDKYLGFYYHFEWYNGDTLIGTDKVRVILTNDTCHNDLVPDAVARRIDEKVAAAKTPEVDLSEYATTDEVSAAISTAVAIKANEIPFTTDKFVTKAFGGFAVGDSVNGLTIAQLFAKLLELTDKNPGENPDEPQVPGVDATPEEIINYLIATNTAMYSQDEYGNLTETPFAVTTWTEPEADLPKDGISTIYHIIDESGIVLESGYQEATDYNEEAWLTIALPDIITNVEVKMYNPGTARWEKVNWSIVPAAEQTLKDYTIWIVPDKYEVQSGDTYRFVVIN